MLPAVLPEQVEAVRARLSLDAGALESLIQDHVTMTILVVRPDPMATVNCGGDRSSQDSVVSRGLDGDQHAARLDRAEYEH
jgi:hypothetical protein